MSKQLFLDKYFGNKFEMEEKIVRILNWNVRNPSYQRATKQCRYIEKLKPHLILLTELKSSSGLRYFKERFSYLDYDLFYEFPEEDYFILIACIFETCEIPTRTEFLPHRMKGIYFKYRDIKGKFFGIYVPSRGPKEKRNVNKRKFQNSVMKTLDEIRNKVKVSRLIIGGDLNVIDPYHIPKYPIFGNWEYEFYEKFTEIGLIDAFRKVNSHQDYSWFGKEGDGYRFDHLFVSKDLENRIKSCYYDHTVREKKLSDHSSMILELEL